MRRVLLGGPLGDGLGVTVRHPDLPGVGGRGRRVEAIDRGHELELVREAPEMEQAVEDDGVIPAGLDDGRPTVTRPVPRHGRPRKGEASADGEGLLDRAPATDGGPADGVGCRPYLQEVLLA